MREFLIILAVVVAVVGMIYFGGVKYLLPKLMYGYTDFTFSGSVIDEDGNDLHKVLVHVIAGRRQKMWTETNYDSRFETVNGKFRFKFDGYSSVSLIFHKRGYEKVDLQFTNGGVYKGMIVVLKQEAVVSDPKDNQEVKR